MNTALRATYVDTFEHSFDDKGRVSFPAEWREAPYESVLFVFPSERGCLRLYPQSWMSDLQQRAMDRGTPAEQRAKMRELAGLAQRVEVDGHGRIKVKSELLKHAGVKSAAVFAGSIDFVELWDAKRYAQQSRTKSTIESVDPGGEIFL
jgi:MraZ protein